MSLRSARKTFGGAFTVALLSCFLSSALAKDGGHAPAEQLTRETRRAVPAGRFSAAVLRTDSAGAAFGPAAKVGPELLGKGSRHRADRWLARDKAAHFAASAFLSAFGYYVARREREWRNRPSQRFGFAFGFAFGIAKEVRDAFTPRGTASWKDLVADAFGCAVATALVAVPDGVVFGGEP